MIFWSPISAIKIGKMSENNLLARKINFLCGAHDNQRRILNRPLKYDSLGQMRSKGHNALVISFLLKILILM